MNTKIASVTRTGKTILLIIFVTMGVITTFSMGYSIGHYSKEEPSNIIINNNIDERFQALEDVYNILVEDFYFGENSDEYRDFLVSSAINGMVDANGDIHTTYFTPEEMAEFMSSLESTIVGIGVRYTEIDHNIFIIEVLRSSPAEKAGLQSGDFIVAVEGVLCKDHDSDYMATLIAGEEGTDVTITINRLGEEFDVTCTRAVIETTVLSKVNGNVGIVTISSFGTETAVELEKHLKDLKSQGVDRLIIDLRDNGGGYASTLDSMCRLFMEKGQIVMREEFRDGQEIIDEVTKSKKIDYKKIVILQNGNSASCSEVFTMALKENCGAIVVGTTSYGKGIAQVSKMFEDGSALKYTDVIWKSGNGVSIHGKGIEPDYEVKLHPALSSVYLVLGEDESYGYDSVSARTAVMQEILDFLGYDVDRMDGYFSQKTESALMKFQKDCGLEATGILDKQTGESLDGRMLYAWHMNRDKYDTQMQKALELVRE